MAYSQRPSFVFTHNLEIHTKSKNMNLRKVFFAVLMVSMIFTSCKKSSELSDAIPADANYVFHIDTKSLIEKSQYDIFKNPTVQQGINVAKAMLKDADKLKFIDDFLADANSVGINLKNEMFMYTNYQVYGIVLGVNDAAKIKDALIKFSIAGEEDIKHNGGTYMLSPGSEACITWDDNKLIILVDLTRSYRNNNSATPINIEELAKKQLQQGSDESINSNKSFAEFMNSKKDMSAFYTMEGLDKMIPLSQITGSPIDITALAKVFEDIKGLSMGMYTSFENGEITMTNKTYFDTPETEKKYRELVEKMLGELKGDHLKYITSDPLFMAAINLKGDGIYNYLEEIGIVNMIYDELSPDIEPQKIEQFVKGFNGDITFALTSLKETGTSTSYGPTTVPELLFFADVTSPQDAYNFIKSIFDDNTIPYIQVSPTVMAVEDNGFKLYFGVNNNTFFATSIESVYNNLNFADLKNNYAGDVKDKMFLMEGDLRALTPFMENDHDLRKILPFFSEFGKYHMTSNASDFSGEGKIELQTKDKNSLAVICQHIDKMITDLSSSFGL